MIRRLNIVELYAGTARSCAPFKQWKRTRIALLVDKSSFARDTYLRNFPSAPYVRGDLLRIRPDEIKALAGGRVDILLACPPCQGFSEVGARGTSDPQNRHVARFGAFVAGLEPMAVALENVPQFVASRQYRAICTLLDSLGYRWTAGILNAARRGSVQCRQRFVLVAIRRYLRVQPAFPRPSHGGEQQYFSYRYGQMMRLDEDPIGLLGQTPSTQRFERILPYKESAWGSCPIPMVADMVAGLPSGGPEALRLGHVPWRHSRSMLRRMAHVPEGGRWKGGMDHYSQSYGRLHRRGLARTITRYFNNAGSGRYWHPVENRALTLREAARIQGYPDSFHFIPPLSFAADLVGNALDAALAEVAYKVIRSCLE